MAVNGTTDLWADLSKFLASIGVTNIRGRLVLCDKMGNFRAWIAIQSCATSRETPNAPAPISSGSGYGYITTVTSQFVDFDPSASGKGPSRNKWVHRGRRGAARARREEGAYPPVCDR